MLTVPQITERFRMALDYAAQKHAQQTRKASDIPYLAHLLAVCSLVMENTSDEDVWIAALLHDAIEDQGGELTAQEIERTFGAHVAELVRGCSELTAEADAPRPTWVERKTRYLTDIKEKSAAVLLISVADKLHNARSVLTDWLRCGDDVYGRFSTGKLGTHWYYQEMINAYKDSGKVPHHLVAQLEEVVSQFAPAKIQLEQVQLSNP